MEWVGRVQATYIHIIKHIPSGNQTWQWANPPCVADFPTFFCLDFYFRDFSIATFHYRRTCTYIHYIALHCIALHCIALHCLTLHYIALHCLTLLYIHTLHTYTYIYALYIWMMGWWDKDTAIGSNQHAQKKLDASITVLPYLAQHPRGSNNTQ